MTLLSLGHDLRIDESPPPLWRPFRGAFFEWNAIARRGFLDGSVIGAKDFTIRTSSGALSTAGNNWMIDLGSGFDAAVTIYIIGRFETGATNNSLVANFTDSSTGGLGSNYGYCRTRSSPGSNLQCNFRATGDGGITFGAVQTYTKGDNFAAAWGWDDDTYYSMSNGGEVDTVAKSADPAGSRYFHISGPTHPNGKVFHAAVFKSAELA